MTFSFLLIMAIDIMAIIASKSVHKQVNGTG